jgi:hypothetical protein
MKLYIVTLPESKSFAEVLEEVKKVDPLSIFTVVEKDKVYEFQDKVPANKVAEVFNGSVKIIEYDIKELLH